MKYRIQKLLAQANLGSRRAAEEYIIAGRVRVNGQVAQIGEKADPETDIITVDGERLKVKQALRYIMYYKPVNVLSTTERQPGDDRPTVREMIPVEGHFFTIGRLDVESEGLVILTNDGDLANRLAHPRYEHTKTYKVTVYGEPDEKTLETWERGIMLPDEETPTAPCSIRVQESGGGQATLRIVMTEGRNRQIRRVAAALGHPVKRLMRTHIGQLGIGMLRKGEWVELSGEDLRLLTTPHSEISYIDKIKRSLKARSRRADLMKFTTATPEQVEAARKNRQAPLLHRKPKKFFKSTTEQSEGEGMDGDAVARRRPARRPADTGARDGRGRAVKPVFRSRLAIDETGDRPASPAAPEGFRSRLSEQDRAPRDDRRSTRSLMRDETGDRGPRRPYQRRDGDSRPPFRRDGDSRPPFRRDGDSRSEGRPPRRDGDSRPPFRRDGDSRSEGRPPFRRDGDSRSEGRPPRRDGDSRPPFRRDGDSRSEGRPPFRRDGDSRPPFRRDGDSRSEGRPPRRDGDSRPPFRRDGDSRSEGRPPFRRDGDSRSEGRPPFRRDGDSRPPRRDGDSRPPFRRDGERPARPAFKRRTDDDE